MLYSMRFSMAYNFQEYYNKQLNEAKMLNSNHALQVVKEIGKQVDEAGYDLYIIGGAVRDEIMGKIPNDYDLNTNMPQEKYLALFDTNSGVNNRRIKDIAHTIKDGEEFETSLLRPGYTIEQQCLETDFTMNSLAKNVKTDKIIDVYGTGVSDIKNHILRYTDFTKDELRAGRSLANFWRMLKFYARYKWEIEPDSLQAMKDWIEVRGDKIYPYNKATTAKVLEGKYVEDMYQLCRDLGVYEKLWGKK